MTAEELKQYSDPRRYNLILTLGTGRLQGWFVPYGRNDIPPVKGIEVAYTPEEDRTLAQIENAVYDNPILLEEYDCHILIDTPKQLLVPGKEPGNLAAQSMKRFYESEESDVFTAPMGEATIAFTLCPGLRSFLNRTFAGVTPQHRLSPLFRWFSADRNAPGRVRVYADVDAPYLHLLAFNGERLLHASTHRAPATADAAYLIFALWQQLGLGADGGQLNISGSPQTRKELMPLLRRHINYVGLSLLPRMENADNIPTPVLLSFA